METNATTNTTTETPSAKPRRTFSDVQDEVTEFASKSKAQFTGVQTRASEGVNGATSAVGKRMVLAGESIVKSGKTTGFRLRRLGKYLDRTSPADMLQDLGSWAEENPRAAGIAMAGGAVAMLGLFGKMRS